MTFLLFALSVAVLETILELSARRRKTRPEPEVDSSSATENVAALLGAVLHAEGPPRESHSPQAESKDQDANIARSVRAE